ncbi:MAG TPA: hypothetical protein VF753_19605 [Terriglobales bacterium]
MKASTGRFAHLLVLTLGIVLCTPLVVVSAFAQVVNSEKNPLQVALLHWYAANVATTFPIGGGGPMAFDGTYMWVCNSGGSSLSKVRVNDGTTATISLPGASGYIAYDGANMWVTSGSGLVEVQASTGTVLGTFPVGSGPAGVAFDGTNIWVANAGSNNVMQIQPSTGNILGTFNVGTAPVGLAFDGNNMWVTNSGSNNVMKLSGKGKVLGTFAVGTAPVWISFDGSHMWVANQNSKQRN